ncbi:hypothetical protein MMC30_006211 [Trapelia coarctata]|nr:hypothetical protein [Trapelia coarctata]
MPPRMAPVVTVAWATANISLLPLPQPGTPYSLPPLDLSIPHPHPDHGRNVEREYNVQAYMAIYGGNTPFPRGAINWDEGHSITSEGGFRDLSSRARGVLRKRLGLAKVETVIARVLQLAAQAVQIVRATGVVLPPAALLPSAQHSAPLAQPPAASRTIAAAAEALLAAAAAWGPDEDGGDDGAE